MDFCHGQQPTGQQTALPQTSHALGLKGPFISGQCLAISDGVHPASITLASSGLQAIMN